ncbi:MAG: hypothetical protein Q3997_06480 [Propionibacteriaceae bacterium]|nr:hypothetical protein [Propionibacteriaceae bacterium]
MCFANIWFLPDCCQGKAFEARTRELTRIEPYLVDVKLAHPVRQAHGLDSARLAYVISKSSCECQGLIGGKGVELYRGALSYPEILSWLTYLQTLLPAGAKIALMRAWSPGDKVTPASVSAVNLKALTETMLANLEEDEMLIIRMGK